MKTYKTKVATCPRCGYVMDRATGMGHDSKVKPGDISLCLRCGQLLRFDADLEPAMALESELEGLDPRQRHLIAMARKHIPSLWKRQ